MNWKSIDDEKPEEGRDLFYFFPFLGVYRGEYKQIEYPKEIFEEGTDPVHGDCFFGGKGFLTDDVTHWMYAHVNQNPHWLPDVPEGYILVGDGKFNEYALESDTVRITKHEYESLKERCQYLEAGHLYGMCCLDDNCPCHIYWDEESDGYRCGGCETIYSTEDVEKNPQKFTSKY